MTVSSQTNKETFDGNSVTTIWDLPFRFFDNADIHAYLIDPATQLTTPLVLGTDYTLTGAGLPEQFGTAPGKLTTTVAVPTGKQLYVERVLDIEQLTDIVNQGRFFPEVHEDVFDRLTMLLQQISADNHGAIRVAIGDPEPNRLPSAPARANLLMGFDSDGNPIAVSPIDGSAADLELMLANSSSAAQGDAMIGMRQPVTGATGRTVHDKLAETVSLKDFGAVGDGVADDTAAVLLAKAYMASVGRDVLVTPGVYLTDPFSINATTYATQAVFIGTDRDKCVIRRRNAGAGAFVTVGSALGTVYQVGLGMRHITIDGGVNTNGDAFVAYDMVRSNFNDVRFMGGVVACHLFGGISVTFNDCIADQAQYGLKIEKFTSLAGGGWPNIIRWNGGELVDNSIWGAWFDHGRMFMLSDVEIEGNGTTLGAAQGGVFIGPGVGDEVITTDTYSIGLIADGCWCEANKGAADFSLNNGLNTIQNTNLFSSDLGVTNDIVITAGRYTLKNINCSIAKTINIAEGAGVISGNIIESSDIPTVSIDQYKTMLIGSNVTTLRGGAVPVVNGVSKPLIQSGTGSTGAAGTTLTFPIPFTSAPVTLLIFPFNGDTTTQITQCVSSALTASSVFVRGLALTSGSSTITQINTGFRWLAIGEK